MYEETLSILFEYVINKHIFEIDNYKKRKFLKHALFVLIAN